MNTSVSRTVSVSIPAPGGRRPTWQRPASRGGPPTCQSRSARTSVRLWAGGGRGGYYASVTPPPTPRGGGGGCSRVQTPSPRPRTRSFFIWPPPLSGVAHAAVRVVRIHDFILTLPVF